MLLHRLPPRIADDDTAGGVGMGIVTREMLAFEQRLEIDQVAVHGARRASGGKPGLHVRVQVLGRWNDRIQAVNDVLDVAVRFDLRQKVREVFDDGIDRG